MWKKKKLLNLLNQAHSGTEAMKWWSTLRVTVLSPFVELVQSPFSLHKAETGLHCQKITAEEV